MVVGDTRGRFAAAIFVLAGSAAAVEVCVLFSSRFSSMELPFFAAMGSCARVQERFLDNEEQSRYFLNVLCMDAREAKGAGAVGPDIEPPKAPKAKLRDAVRCCPKGPVV